MFKFNGLGLNGPGFNGPTLDSSTLSSPTFCKPALRRLALGLAVCCLPTLSWAQNNAAGELEEVVVTAQFRETPLMQTSGSISIMDQTALFDRGALHLQDVLNVLPNVNFSSGGSRARFVQIRGVGDLEQFVDPKYFPSVGITMDDVDMNGFASAALLMDTEQVEVLRGPQGTRYGTNALAGMVNIRSYAPTAQLEGYAQAGMGNYGQWNATAAVGGPLSESFQGRFAVSQSSSDGYIRNDYLGRKDTSKIDEFSTRGKLQVGS